MLKTGCSSKRDDVQLLRKCLSTVVSNENESLENSVKNLLLEIRR